MCHTVNSIRLPTHHIQFRNYTTGTSSTVTTKNTIMTRFNLLVAIAVMLVSSETCLSFTMIPTITRPQVELGGPQGAFSSTNLYTSSLTEPISSQDVGDLTIEIEEPTTLFPPYAAKSLDARLLCATQCSYSIAQPYFRAAAYRPATVAKRITRGMNSALIGYTYDGITISFRGTQNSSLLDWLQNAALFLSDVTEENSLKIQGKVHNGFFRGTKSLWKPIKSLLKEMLQECEANGWSTNIYLTGHSKGGAMASIAAMLMVRDSDLPDPTHVVTFASARVGDSKFRDVYNQKVNQTSYEAHLDLVPFLPPSSTTMDVMGEKMLNMIQGALWSETSLPMKDKFVWDYQTVGQRKFIDEDNIIVDEVTDILDAQRINAIDKNTFSLIDEFREAQACLTSEGLGKYFEAIADCIEDDDDEDYSDDEEVSP